MKPLLFLDTETTGLAEPALVEIAYDTDGKEFSSCRCKPRKPIELDATVINGITNEAVSDLPLFKDTLGYEAMKELFEGSILVAHNARFDIGVLRNEGINVREYIDTKEVAQSLYPDAPKHRLQHLRYWLKLDVEGAAHTAAGDVAVLRALWSHMDQGASRWVRSV